MDVLGFDMGLGIIQNLIDVLMIFGAVALVGGTLAVLFKSGFFDKKPVNVLVIVKRAGESVALHAVKGRFIKAKGGDGNFEIQHGFMKKITVGAPKEEYIYPGDWVVFERRASEDYRPVKIKFNEAGNIQLDPALQPAMKLAHASQVEKTVLRFQTQNVLIQYAPAVAIIVAALIVGGALLSAAGAVNEPGMATANAFQQVADKLANATVILDRSGTATTVATSTIEGYYPPG